MNEPDIVLLTEEQKEEIVRLASATGAKVALERIEAEQKKADAQRASWMYHNTKELIRNYRSFADVARSAVYTLQGQEYIRKEYEALMTPGRYDDLTIESIKKNAIEAEIMCAHIRSAMECCRDHCYHYGTDVDRRRWRVTYNLYISTDEPRMTVTDIMSKEGFTEETYIYRDFDNFCTMASKYFFGVGALELPRKKR